MDPDNSGLRVQVTDARGRPVRARGLAAWLGHAAPSRARGEVAIALVSDAHIRKLNRTYRGKDYATDVLSFPARSARLKPRAPQFPVEREALAQRNLGDIVIATGVARRQARDLGHSLTVELRILALHGLLHLLGYDHERDRGRMRTLEQRLLRRSGLWNGLIARAHPSTSSGRAVRGKHARGEPVEPRALPR